MPTYDVSAIITVEAASEKEAQELVEDYLAYDPKTGQGFLQYHVQDPIEIDPDVPHSVHLDTGHPI